MAKVYIIALAKIIDPSKELEVYAYSGNKIYLYSAQWDLGVSWDYETKIKQIALDADKNLVEWVDIVIEDGQEVTRKSDRILVDGIETLPFRRLSEKNFSNIGPMTTKIYNELLKSREKEEVQLREILKETFEEGLFSKHVADVIEFNFQHMLDYDELNNLDKQIIVRVKIEGYMFVVDFIKALLKTDLPQKIDYCEMFLSRVFMLESQNFINGNLK